MDALYMGDPSALDVAEGVFFWIEITLAPGINRAMENSLLRMQYYFYMLIQSWWWGIPSIMAFRWSSLWLGSDTVSLTMSTTSPVTSFRLDQVHSPTSSFLVEVWGLIWSSLSSCSLNTDYIAWFLKTCLN